MTDVLLEAQRLHTYYGQSHILHGIDLTIKKSEAVALMGRNGMGKTTLIKSLLGIIPVQRGKIMIADQDCTHLPTWQRMRRGIAYVPEGRGIFPNLTVLENLVMAARIPKQTSAPWDLERVLHTFPRLQERISNGGWQLSGGEQQMLSIGRALMTNPDLLILDEATEGLAPLIAREIWRIVREIRLSGIATIIVDKNHATVTSVTDRAVIIVKGQVVFAGSSEAVRQDSKLIQMHLGV